MKHFVYTIKTSRRDANGNQKKRAVLPEDLLFKDLQYKKFTLKMEKLRMKNTLTALSTASFAAQAQTTTVEGDNLVQAVYTLLRP